MKKVLTTGMQNEVPDCPHCGGDMDQAVLTLEDLIFALPMRDFIPIGPDGYAEPDRAHEFLRLTCPTCEKPSLFAGDGAFTMLAGARTEADERYLGKSLENKVEGVSLGDGARSKESVSDDLSSTWEEQFGGHPLRQPIKPNSNQTND